MYQGPDREARILEQARKEGTVVIYTSLNLKDSVPLTEAFEKKYGVKVVAVAREQREGCAARRDRGPRQALHPGRVRDQRPGDGSALPRSSCSSRSTVPRSRTCPRRPSRSTATTSRPVQLLRDRLEHESGQAAGRAQQLPGPARSEMDRQDRHRGQRRRLVRGDGEAHGRAEGTRLLPQARRAEAAAAHRAHADGGARRLRRDPARARRSTTTTSSASPRKARR